MTQYDAENEILMLFCVDILWLVQKRMTSS